MSKKKYKTKRDYTQTDLDWIRLQNKTKLDELFAEGPDYIERLGRKYYGEGWMKILDGKHPARTERHKENCQNSLKRLKGEKVPFRKTLQDYKVVQYSLEDKKIKTFANARAACKHYGWDEDKQSQSIIRCAKGEHETTFGYKWKFKE